MTKPIDPRIAQARPGWALVVLAAPVVAVVIVVVLYSGMAYLGLSGRPAEGGDRVLELSTCPDGVAVIKARLTDVGLPVSIVAEGSDWLIHTAFTGRADVDDALPLALAQPGRLQVRGAGGVLFGNEAVSEATYRLDGMMDMWLLLRIDETAAEAVVDGLRGDPQGRMTFVVDGADVAMQPNRRAVQRGEVEGIPLADMDQVTRMRLIAEWSMQIDHMLPCAATVVDRRP